MKTQEKIKYLKLWRETPLRSSTNLRIDCQETPRMRISLLAHRKCNKGTKDNGKPLRPKQKISKLCQNRNLNWTLLETNKTLIPSLTIIKIKITWTKFKLLVEEVPKMIPYLQRGEQTSEANQNSDLKRIKRMFSTLSLKRHQLQIFQSNLAPQARSPTTLPSPQISVTSKVAKTINSAPAGSEAIKGTQLCFQTMIQKYPLSHQTSIVNLSQWH